MKPVLSKPEKPSFRDYSNQGAFLWAFVWAIEMADYWLERFYERK